MRTPDPQSLADFAELGAEECELRAEIGRLRAENAELKKMRDALVEVLRAVNPYVQ